MKTNEIETSIISAKVAAQLLAFLVLCGVLASPGRAGLLTDVEKNAFVVGETVAMTVSMMKDVYGLSSEVMRFDSTTFSATGWMLDLMFSRYRTWSS